MLRRDELDVFKWRLIRKLQLIGCKVLHNDASHQARKKLAGLFAFGILKRTGGGECEQEAEADPKKKKKKA